MAGVLGRSHAFAPACVVDPDRHASSRTLEVKGRPFVGFGAPSSTLCGSLRSSSCDDLFGRKMAVADGGCAIVKGASKASPVQMKLALPKIHKWWEKGMQPNMKEISSAQDVVDSLSNAGDKLVVVGFFSPGCGGCRALHPKICQFAEANPEVLFLQVNHEEHKSMCYSLAVHVLPFFRFYRGAHGRLCSFSCTVATIKKFKDAMAKHNTHRCSLGPAKGLEEEELLALAANKDLSFTHTRKLAGVPAPDELAPKTDVKGGFYVKAWR